MSKNGARVPSLRYILGMIYRRRRWDLRSVGVSRLSPPPLLRHVFCLSRSDGYSVHTNLAPACFVENVPNLVLARPEEILPFYLAARLCIPFPLLSSAKFLATCY